MPGDRGENLNLQRQRGGAGQKDDPAFGQMKEFIGRPVSPNRDRHADQADPQTVQRNRDRNAGEDDDGSLPDQRLEEIGDDKTEAEERIEIANPEHASAT